MSDANCRICLHPLNNGGQYHEACSRKLFDAPRPPAFPYSWEQINGLAAKIVRQRVTVPGVQPKLSIHIERRDPHHGARFTLVGMEGGYILKPPVERFPEMPELEHLTMCMARCFGIATAECALIPIEGGRLSFITKRMDREGAAKLHMEDMCQLTDRLTDQKYRGSMEQVGRAILRYCTNPLFDALRLFEVTLFSFLTGNSDMHLKNFSLLYRPGGDIALSPAYDLLSTVLLLPEDTEEIALTLNGRKRRLTTEDFEQFGASLRLTGKQIENARERFSRSLPDALATLRRGCCDAKTKQRYETLIADRTRRMGL